METSIFTLSLKKKNSNNSQSADYFIPLEINNKYKVKILEIESPNLLHVLPCDIDEKHINLLFNLKNYYTKRQIIPIKNSFLTQDVLDVGSLCLVKHNNQFFRGKIIFWLEKDLLKVFLIDKGQSHVVLSKDVAPLNDELSKIPFLAHPLRLDGIDIPIDGWQIYHFNYMRYIFQDPNKIFEVKISANGKGIIKRNGKVFNDEIENLKSFDESNFIEQLEELKLKSDDDIISENTISHSLSENATKNNEIKNFNKFSNSKMDNIENLNKLNESFAQKEDLTVEDDKISANENNYSPLLLDRNIQGKKMKLKFCDIINEIIVENEKSDEQISQVKKTEQDCFDNHQNAASSPMYPSGLIIDEELDDEYTWDPIQEDYDSFYKNVSTERQKNICKHFLMNKPCRRRNCKFLHSFEPEEKARALCKTFCEMYLEYLPINYRGTIDNMNEYIFYLRINNYLFGRENLNTLQQSINNSPLNRLTSPPSIGELVLAANEKIFFRARVIRYFSIDMVEVFLIDFGRSIINSIEEMREIEPKWLHYPPQSLKCTLKGVKLKNNQKSLEFARRTFLNKIVSINFLSYSDFEDKYLVQIFQDNTDIKDILLNENHADIFHEDFPLISNNSKYIPG